MYGIYSKNVRVIFSFFILFFLRHLKYIISIFKRSSVLRFFLLLSIDAFVVTLQTNSVSWYTQNLIIPWKVWVWISKYRSSTNTNNLTLLYLFIIWSRSGGDSIEVRSQSQAWIFATLYLWRITRPSNQSPLIVDGDRLRVARLFDRSFRSFFRLLAWTDRAMCDSSRELNDPLNFNFDWNASDQKIGEIVDRYRVSEPDRRYAITCDDIIWR